MLSFSHIEFIDNNVLLALSSSLPKINKVKFIYNYQKESHLFHQFSGKIGVGENTQ